MEEGSVALGSRNPSLTNSGIQDNFRATWYGVPSDFRCCGPIYSTSTTLLKQVLLIRY